MAASTGLPDTNFQIEARPVKVASTSTSGLSTKRRIGSEQHHAENKNWQIASWIAKIQPRCRLARSRKAGKRQRAALQRHEAPSSSWSRTAKQNPARKGQSAVRWFSNRAATDKSPANAKTAHHRASNVFMAENTAPEKGVLRFDSIRPMRAKARQQHNPGIGNDDNDRRHRYEQRRITVAILRQDQNRYDRHNSDRGEENTAHRRCRVGTGKYRCE